jgi:superfamily II DNA or RNA helicase
MEPAHKFDKDTFDAKQVKANMAAASPKMVALFDKIRELDAQDMAKEGKQFKHMIFSDVKTFGYGAKILMAGFLAQGYHAAFDKSFTLDEEDLRKHTGKNVGFLCSTAVYGKPMGVRFRKELLATFNRRPDNVHGDHIRFLILDPGFKEGIDLFDLKYVHLFEPLLTPADEKQAIGRGTRLCGQRGLTFHPSKGWPLHVFRYDVEVPSEVADAPTLSQLYLQQRKIDVRKLRVAAELERLVQEGAVDAELTAPIHRFTINQGTQEGGAKKKQHALRAKGPLKKHPHEALQQYIRERFLKKYRWPDATLENKCAPPNQGGAANIVKFTPTQEFVRHYFTPQLPYKGMLLHHSTGSGKTCSAVAIATTQWEPRGYTILWVTRYTLKADIWKNMFQQVCSLVVKEKLKRKELALPEDAVQHPAKYLSKHWMMPISFKQFSNMCAGKNELYHTLVQRNGQEDPLRKTLIIMDEAHKLYDTNVAGAERPNSEAIEAAIQHSYATSKNNSARVLLMTATPFTDDPMGMMRLMNLLRSREDALPTNFEAFAEQYLEDDGSFSGFGRTRFLDDIAGYISFLNREKDARQFAYPVFHSVLVPLSRSDHRKASQELLTQTRQMEQLTANVKEGKEAIKETRRKVKMETKQKQDAQCSSIPVKERKACKERIAREMATFQQSLLEELETKVERDAIALQARKKEVDTWKKSAKKTKHNDATQEHALFARCKLPAT